MMKTLFKKHARFCRNIRPSALTVSLILCLFGVQTASAATHTWANTNVLGTTPATTLDWFSGGTNPQGGWIGGNPIPNAFNTQISFFQDTTTSLGNTGTNGNTQTANLNNGGTPFLLKYLTLSGKASETPGANLVMTLSGDSLNFSEVGTIDVRGVNNVQTLNYTASNPIIIGSASTARTLYLQGSGSAGLVLSGALSELKASGGKVIKQGPNTVTLSGDSAISGGLEMLGGTIRLAGQNTTTVNNVDLRRGNTVFDLAAGDDRWSGGAAVPAVTFNGGTLTVKGRPTGTSSQTLGNIKSTYVQSAIIVDPNGGDGTTVHLGNTWVGAANSGWGTIVIDRSAPNATVRTTATTVTELLVFENNYGATGVLAKDATGIGFATVVDGEVLRYTNAIPLPETDATYTQHYKTSGSMAMTSGTTRQLATLQLDASDEAGELDLGAGTIKATLLVTGGHDYTIKNGSLDNISLHHFGTGTLRIDANIGTWLRKFGPGRVILNGPKTFSSASTEHGLSISDGVVQAIDGESLPANRLLRLIGGVFQSHGSFVRTVDGNSPYDAKVSWILSSFGNAGRGGGFAAQGGTLTINLNGGAALAWGANWFVQNNQVLIFGSTSADSLLDWQNEINLGNSYTDGYLSGSWIMREVQVDDNPDSTNDIAQISGLLTGSVSGLIKTGDGTLCLTAANTYSGPTDVNAGTLLVNGSLNTADSPVTVNAGGTLGGSGTVNRPVTLYADATLNGSLGLTCGTNVTMKSGTKIAWDSKATGTVTVNGTLTLPATASVTFGSVPAGQLVLFESPNAIVGSVAGWTVTPAIINLRVSANGKQVFASSGGTLIMVR